MQISNIKAQTLRACAKLIKHPQLELAGAMCALGKATASLKLSQLQFEKLGEDTAKRIERDTKSCKLLECLSFLATVRDTLSEVKGYQAAVPDVPLLGDDIPSLKEMNANVCFSNVDAKIFMDAVELLTAKSTENLKVGLQKIRESPGVDSWLETSWHRDEAGEIQGSDLKSALGVFDNSVGKVKVRALNDLCDEMSKACSR